MWIDFSSRNRRVLDFYGYEIGPTYGLPSQPKFCLLTKFVLNDDVRILNDNGNEVGVSSSLIVIDATCNLSLETANDRHITSFNLSMQGDRGMRNGGICLFSTFINPKDVEDLSRMIAGETVRIKWRIDGYASIPNNQYAFPMRFDVGNSTDGKDRWPQINPDEFSKIMQKLGLHEEYITSFPLKIPTSVSSSPPNLPSAINRLLPDLNTLVNNLNKAVNTLRSARDDDGYRQVMDQVKTSVESIHQYVDQNKKDLAQGLFIDVGVINDIDSTGAQNAAEDVVGKFGKILKNLYLLSSKAAHTTYSVRQPSPRFNFVPDYSDAEFVLTLGLVSAKYLLNRIVMRIEYNK
jgi:hypothetical protein